MKKTVALLLGVWAGIMPVLTQAHQDRSFTSTATAGLFEDTYDYFKYSPAYLPGMKRTTLWTQLSNLQSQNEQVFNTSGTGNGMYYLAGQTDLGVGHLGVALDWYSGSWAYNTNVYGYGTVGGFGENTYLVYEDLDTDGVVDARQEIYGKSSAGDNYQEGDVHLMYGLGSVAGLDAGVGLRVYFWHDQYSYDPWSYYGSDYASFEYSARERRTNLLTGQDTFLLENSGSGAFDYGENEWRVILSGRSQDALGFLPKLDVVVNVEPYFMNRYNNFKQDISLFTDYSPSDPNVYSDVSHTYTLRGMQNSSGYVPYNGFGTGLKLRGEYPLLPWLQMTGWLGTDLSSWTSKNGTMDVNEHSVTRTTTWVTDGFYTNVVDENKYEYFKREDKGSTVTFNAKVRGIIPVQKWKLALGAGVNTSANTTEQVYTTGMDSQEHTDLGRGLPSENYTVYRTRMTKTQTTYENSATTVELPIAVMFEVLQNLTLQVGARHTITSSSSTTSTILKERVNETFTTVYDDGRVGSTAIGAPSGVESSRQSYVNVSRYTQMTYGLTWVPYEDVQVDLNTFGTILSLNNYRLSLSLFF